MATISKQLDDSRKSLLDLSTRNRLIHIPQNSKQAKIIEVVDELSAEVFRLIIKENRALSFLGGKEKNEEANTDYNLNLEKDIDTDLGELPQPENDEADERGISKRHSDHRLQTLLTSEGLQKRLLSLYYDALTFEEEQGVNILYIALGMLKWFEDDNSTVERCAPLVLVPVSLHRSSAAEKFKIKWRNEDPAANLSLQAKMKFEFGLIIPDLPEDDDLDIVQYLKTVQQAVSSKSRFRVEENKIILGFFSFAKFLMYRDLDATNWPDSNKIDQHQLITGLIQDGFPPTEGLIDEDSYIDDHLPVERIFHVVDADSSQTLAIEEVRRGRNLVIQGPPGTGKSQTITNIIASAVADGKKVLFVSEKMAALEVVQRRMRNIGLGPICFELHSSKSNKRMVLEELKRTSDLGRPVSQNNDGVSNRLSELQGKLNLHSSSLHELHSPSSLTAYQIIGNLVRLKQNGVETKGVFLENFHEWNSQDKKEKESLLKDVTNRISEIGTPNQNIWRGVNRSQLLPSEFDKMCGDIQRLQDKFNDILEKTKQIEIAFNIQNGHLVDFIKAQNVACALSTLPECDNKSLSSQIWENNKVIFEDIVSNGTRFYELKNKLLGKISEAAMETSLGDCRQLIAMHGESFFRVFNSKYKKAINLLKSILLNSLPKDNKQRLEIIDEIQTAQKLESFIKGNAQNGKDGFGKLWQELNSDWTKLSKVNGWYRNLPLNELPKDFLTNCSKIEFQQEWNSVSAQLSQDVPAFFNNVSAIFENLKLDTDIAFSSKHIQEIDRNDFSLRISSWLESAESISKWINFKNRYNKLEEEGLLSFADKLWNGIIEPKGSDELFQRAYFDGMSELIFSKHPNLREFDGEYHNSNVNKFKSDDNYCIEQARIELRGKHYSEMPRNEGGIGPLGILNGEFAKKRNHLPIRKLIKKAGRAIQALKPVFMMSPLSVAQFLEPGVLQFDLLVIDEASQVEPVDALGGVARAKQIVVVGDTRQLPPTRFFARMTGNDVPEEDTEDNNSVATKDVESILGLCLAKGLPQRMLRWHYRSKHQSLIAVSNKEFYENKLFIIPSPYDAASGMGLKFNYLPNGVFDSGATATNQVEAKAVAEAVIKHAKETPQFSLGIGAFSMKQKQAIIDELELLRRKHPETEVFFSGAHPDEPFFIKNLENIQGDERDVIFISIGYGRNQSGYMAMRFGPLSNEGGERRLNVLISRAKRQCVVFTSITADDIDLERAKGLGVASLKLFLKFAQTGKLDYGKMTEREPDSVFEEQVASALRAKGFDVKTQIGIAGFFIDAAIVDPTRPGRFLLGIECDGANYHSSHSARDRDRLRQSVLEEHGWIIHRIWSTDWFRRPKEQLERVLSAIESAQQLLALQEEIPEKVIPKSIFEIAATDEVIAVKIGARELSSLYQEASFSVPLHIEPHEMYDKDMATIVSKIIEIESPIHESEIITRVRSLWNLARAGTRIQSKVKSGLTFASKNGLVKVENGFYLHTNNDVIVRDRSMAKSSSLKKIECIPPQEIRKAIKLLIETNFGAGSDQIIFEVARLLGFKSTSSQLRESVKREIEFLILKGIIIDNNDGFLKLS